MAVAAERLEVAVVMPRGGAHAPRTGRTRAAGRPASVTRFPAAPAHDVRSQRSAVRVSSRAVRATRTVRRRRAVVLALAAVVVAIVLACVVAFQPPAVARAVAQPPPVVVVVDEGETLWDLVGPHVPAGRSRQAYVSEVVAENGVDARALLPGTAVRLPR